MFESSHDFLRLFIALLYLFESLSYTDKMN